MATSKTVNVTTGKILNYQITKEGYKPVTGSIYVDSDKVINVNMISTSSSNEVYTLGDRILGMASFVCYYKPGGEYDTKPISTALISQTVGNGLTNIGVKKGIFENQINPNDNKTGRIETYEFEYDGSDWIFDGNAVNLGDYGIFYNTISSTISSGDKLEITYTVYTKYACFVLDANYRTNKTFGMSNVNFPNYPDYTSWNSGSGSSNSTWYYNQLYGQESATWCNQMLLDNEGYQWSDLPALYYCRTLGKYILPNGLEIYPLIPNTSELRKIWENRVYLDSIDPYIQSGNTSYSLINWSVFNQSRCWTIQEVNVEQMGYVDSNGSVNNSYKHQICGVIPVFEVPCM